MMYQVWKERIIGAKSLVESIVRDCPNAYPTEEAAWKRVLDDTVVNASLDFRKISRNDTRQKEATYQAFKRAAKNLPQAVQTWLKNAGGNEKVSHYKFA